MNDKFIIMSFPRYAGGKFISNCLSLSKFCCPQHPGVAKHLLNYPDDYNYRLDAVMSTLPPDRSSMIDWISKYEFGDTQLYQDSFTHWLSGNISEPSDLVNSLLNSKFYLFLTAHGGDTAVRQLLKIWPDSTIIKLINHSTFSKISKNLKSTDNKSIEEHAGNYCKQKYSELAGGNWPTWEEFESSGYDIQRLAGYDSVADEILEFYNWRNVNNKTLLFNIDHSIFNQTQFLSAMETLYFNLGLVDYNPGLISKFWQSYMALHVDNIDIT